MEGAMMNGNRVTERSRPWALVAVLLCACVSGLARASAGEPTPVNGAAIPDEAAIGKAVPLLLSRREVVAPVTVDRVILARTDAIVVWHASYAVGLLVLKKYGHAWQLVGYADRACGPSPGWTALKRVPPLPPYDGAGASPAPSAEGLTQTFTLPPELASRGMQSLSSLLRSTPSGAAIAPGERLIRPCFPHNDF
jgi:hypothetical protein